MNTSPKDGGWLTGLIGAIGLSLAITLSIYGAAMLYIQFFSHFQPPATATSTIAFVAQTHIEMSFDMWQRIQSGGLGAWDFVNDTIIVDDSPYENTVMNLFLGSSSIVHYDTYTTHFTIQNDGKGTLDVVVPSDSGQITPTSTTECVPYANDMGECDPVATAARDGRLLPITGHNSGEAMIFPDQTSTNTQSGWVSEGINQNDIFFCDETKQELPLPSGSPDPFWRGSDGTCGLKPTSTTVAVLQPGKSADFHVHDGKWVEATSTPPAPQVNVSTQLLLQAHDDGYNQCMLNVADLWGKNSPEYALVASDTQTPQVKEWSCAETTTNYRNLMPYAPSDTNFGGYIYIQTLGSTTPESEGYSDCKPIQ